MITETDIQRLLRAFREDFPTRLEFSEMQNDFRSLQTSVDHIAKSLDTYHKEVVVLNHRMTNLEKK